MIELERTYLLKSVPNGLKDCKHKEIIDIYIPKNKDHPTLRIRKNGNKYEMTKKEPVQGSDTSKQEEQTINLTEEEFNGLTKVEGKRVCKIRHYYPYKSRIAEIDVFQESLLGLILVDFEFDKEDDKDSFEMPDFCLADVTQELFTAGGMLCGKKYEDIERDLKRFGYKRMRLD